MTNAADTMSWLQVIVLSIVQGLTEFLPVSSSGHLRIVSQLFWGEDAGASFTAVIQLGTELAVLVYFAKDIWRILTAWFAGLADASKRGFDYRMGWMVIAGTIPVGLAGVLLKDLIRDNFRNLWITATVLIVFSFVFILAERMGKKTRGYEDLTMADAIIMGLWQCLALIPGVSRSGGTISGGLLRNLDREVATRFSFLLAIPAVLANVEAMPEDARGEILLEVQDADHHLDIQVPSGWSLRWIHRAEAPAGFPALVEAARTAQWPGTTDGIQVFAHGEREAMKALRPVLFEEHGLDRAQVSLSGYWARGRDEDAFQAEFDRVRRVLGGREGPRDGDPRP